MLRTVLWAIAGAVVLPASAFTILVILIGAVDICGPGGENSGCATALGIVVLAAVPAGAVLFGWLSRFGASSQGGRRQMRFGR